MQVDEYQVKITPVKATCGNEFAKTITDRKKEALESDLDPDGVQTDEMSKGPIFNGVDKGIPVLINEEGIQVEQVNVSDGRQTFEEKIYNDVPGMADNWYWRDKPLRKNTIKQGQKYWVD